ncbi:MAG: acyl-CoA desaturase [Candidatus Pacebacteria bacterium]|nr:acyl-CoA desaturase [Candidatus Paceibacterota bacterium]MDD5356907.1 acyl-CoA desaturase [Candidatus Paceibacterota bacterium]
MKNKSVTHPSERVVLKRVASVVLHVYALIMLIAVGLSMQAVLSAVSAYLFIRCVIVIVQFEREIRRTDEGKERKHLKKGDRAKLAPINWVRSIGFFSVHVVGIAGPFVVGWSWWATGLAVFLYYLRMFFITGFYHRYFSHKSFKSSRRFVCIMALCGASALQRSATWWAAVHRWHHAHSDQDESDRHSPVVWNIFETHFGWLNRKGAKIFKPLSDEFMQDPVFVKSQKYPWVYLPAVIMALGCYILGVVLSHWFYDVSGGQLLIAFFTSTTALYHGTAFVNSITHMMGERSHDTKDNSGDVWWLVLFVLGEWKHNKHHHDPSAAKESECDPTYWGLLVLERLGLIWDLIPEKEERDKLRAA